MSEVLVIDRLTAGAEIQTQVGSEGEGGAPFDQCVVDMSHDALNAPDQQTAGLGIEATAIEQRVAVRTPNHLRRGVRSVVAAASALALAACAPTSTGGVTSESHGGSSGHSSPQASPSSSAPQNPSGANAANTIVCPGSVKSFPGGEIGVEFYIRDKRNNKVFGAYVNQLGSPTLVRGSNMPKGYFNASTDNHARKSGVVLDQAVRTGSAMGKTVLVWGADGINDETRVAC